MPAAPGGGSTSAASGASPSAPSWAASLLQRGAKPRDLFARSAGSGRAASLSYISRFARSLSNITHAPQELNIVYNVKDLDRVTR